MPWYHKEQLTPFDGQPIEGLEFLYGDALARHFGQEWVQARKYPVIHFPSGFIRELLEQPQGRAVHLFGSLALPQTGSRDEAYASIHDVAQEYGYDLARQGETGLIILNPYTGRGYRLQYDKRHRRLVNISHFPQEAMELLPGDIRAALPPLYANEQKGMEAVAPVKFFSPDSSWTWYPTEFDGEDLFFGLASGFDVELGYFSVNELERVRGPLGLAVERDLYFEPQTLRELQRYERQLKGL